MIRRAKLYARFSDPDGSYPRTPVLFSKQGKPIEPRPPQGSRLVQYQIRVAGKFLGAGDNFAVAVDQLRQQQARLSGGVTRAEATLAPVAPAPEISTSTVSDAGGRVRIATAAAEFVQELRDTNKDKYTVAMYANALRDFQRCCEKEYVDQIDRRDLLAFLTWMRQNLQSRVKGAEERTYKNKLNYLGTFLARHGVQAKKVGNRQGKDDPGLLYRSDLPKVMKKKPVKYQRDEIDLLLKHADVDEADYLLFLLWSGWRDEEVMYAQYSDFDFKRSTVLVQAKPQFDWRPKDCEEREITLPTEITKRMRERMDRPQQYTDGFRKPTVNDIVFPNGEGRADSHLIHRLHTVAKKAGLNLVGKRAGHMFRKTAGSRVAKQQGLMAAMAFLGHSDIKTTALYLALDKTDAKRQRQLADEAYNAGD